MRANTAESFWAKVDIGAPDECWPWKLRPDQAGYGSVKFQGRAEKAHRLAYQLHHGITLARPIPKAPRTGTFVVMHTCDNRPCCNPAHLRLGTDLDNSRDCFAKGRANRASGDQNGTRTHPERLKRGDEHPARTRPDYLKRGSQHRRAKLTEQNALKIRERADAGECISDLARDYGVSSFAVHCIKYRKTWKHI